MVFCLCYTMDFSWIDWDAIDAARAGEISETINTKSPCLTSPFDFTSSIPLEMLASMSSERSMRRGNTPHWRFKPILVLSSSVNANIGGLGRFRDRREAMWPCFVSTNIASTESLLAATKHMVVLTSFRSFPFKGNWIVSQPINDIISTTTPTTTQPITFLIQYVSVVAKCYLLLYMTLSFYSNSVSLAICTFISVSV